MISPVQALYKTVNILFSIAVYYHRTIAIRNASQNFFYFEAFN